VASQAIILQWRQLVVHVVSFRFPAACERHRFSLSSKHLASSELLTLELMKTKQIGTFTVSIMTVVQQTLIPKHCHI